MNDSNRTELFDFAIAAAANKLHISSSITTSDALLTAINTANPQTFDTLKVFFEAWDEWFNHHKYIVASGSTGQLTPAQHERLAHLCIQLDQARASLMQHLRSQ